MFKEFNLKPTDFNTIIMPISELETEKSDNGYYLVKGIWGTCFHRIAKKKDRFEIIANRLPKCAHTYTKIPAALASRTYFVYVNWQKTSGFKMHLPAGGSIVGMSEAQKHVSNPNWLSASYLVYCPNGEAPLLCVSDIDKHAADEVCIVDCKYQERIITIEKITRGFPVRYLAVNEDGYIVAQPKNASDDAFETKPKLLVLNQPANLEPICIDSVNPSNFEGPEMAQQALETGVIADEAAIAAGCNCKYTDEEGTTYFYKI